MSPFRQNRSVPYSGSPSGGRIGEDIFEPQRSGPSRSAAKSAGGQAESGQCRPAARDQLSTSQAGMEALPGAWSAGLKARRSREDQQSSQGREVPKARAGTVASQVQWRNRGAFWSDAGSRALGERGWDRDPSRNSAAVDVGRRFMESGT